MAGAALLTPAIRSARAALVSEVGVPFSPSALIERARALSQEPFAPRSQELPEPLRTLDYDGYRDIRFDPAQALWRDQDVPFQVQFFHLGYRFQRPVRIFEVSDGAAWEVLYAPEMFNLGGNDFGESLPPDLGFAGFRVHHPINTPDYFDEVVVFLGASYFRAVGRHQGYGLSARGLAVNTANQGGEEFPSFREFWLERPGSDAGALVVHALLDGPSATGACSFTIRPGDATVMDVVAVFFPRQNIARFGMAPMTSMFLFDNKDSAPFDDFRPRVHDSQGLSIWSGRGEWIWRPLRNPSRLTVSYYGDENPRGFGLLQRERDFTDYQDLESRYERRPSLWVEPLGGWGRGAIQLVELPIKGDIFDNIVAFWVPESPAEAGSEWQLAYRLHWGPAPPTQPMGAVAATLIGAGSTRGTRKFVIDFDGGDLESAPPDSPIEAVVTLSAGRIVTLVSQRNEAIGGWRTFFDIDPEEAEEIDIRCFLRNGEAALTETWSFLWQV